jgi:glycosyltransferase involved in cell wall biosynthesis
MITNSFSTVIFPVRNEGKHIESTMNSLFAAKTSKAFEVIVVNDGSTDGCCDFLETYLWKERVRYIHTLGIGPANARNAGAGRAAGDFLIFCDAHLEFADGWMDELVDTLLSGDTDAVTPAIGAIGHAAFIGYGQSLTPKLRTVWNSKKDHMFETAVLPGGCFAIQRAAFEAVGGFETGFQTWGHEDVELSIRLWLFGYRCHVQPKAKVWHLFRSVHPYDVNHYDTYHNFLRMAYLHFKEARIEKCKKMIRSINVQDVESHLYQTEVARKRADYGRKRLYDDDWYFQKFKIDF